MNEQEKQVIENLLKACECALENKYPDKGNTKFIINSLLSTAL